MKIETPKQPATQRKAYIKPEIEKVHLMTGETMVDACRSFSIPNGPTDGEGGLIPCDTIIDNCHDILVL